MTRPESSVQSSSAKLLQRIGGLKLYRNAQYCSPSGKKRGGLGKGTSDYVGWVERRITPDMVGQRVAIFVGLEYKAEKNGRTSKAQREFLEDVKRAGGIAGVARSEREALAIVRQEKEGREI